jgi:membrane protease YdiL (CAAX protease family)
VLLAPLATGSLSTRGLDGFWTWAALAAVIATLEEIAIRGALYRRWSEEAGPVAAIVAGAVVFALIHLPRYGVGAMPLDVAVGLALGGLRALTGRVAPCAVAHVIADWGAWFWT